MMNIILFLQCALLASVAMGETGSSLRSRIESDLVFNYKHRPVIYMFSHSTGEVVLPFIIHLKKIKSTNILCADATEASLSKALSDFSASRSETALMVVRGAESLRGDQIENLNFLHGVSDSNTQYPSLVVVLLWDSAVHPIPADTLFRDHFRRYLASGGEIINPAAIIGRFSLTAVDGVRASKTDFNVFWSSLCSGDESAGHHDQEQSINTAAVMGAALLLLIVALGAGQLKTNASTAPEDDAQESNEDDKTSEDATASDTAEAEGDEVGSPEQYTRATPPRSTKSKATPQKQQIIDKTCSEDEDAQSSIAAEEETVAAMTTPAPTRRGRRSMMRTPARTVRRDSEDDYASTGSTSVRRSTRKIKPVQFYE